MIIAHRGASGYRPEHTRVAYDLALELGADAIEPDVVPSKDGVLVIRHENDITGTTDVAEHEEFADRRTTKTVDGVEITGWFIEDFTWDELQTLRVKERMPRLRRANTKWDGTQKLMRLSDLFRTIDRWQRILSRKISAVVEIKHPRFFTELGYDIPTLLQNELSRAGWGDGDGRRLIFESFELQVLRDIAAAEMPGQRVLLIESEGRPADAGWRNTPDKKSTWFMSNAGLREVKDDVHAVSVRKEYALRNRGRFGSTKPASLIRRAAKQGLGVYVWTLRAENFYLIPSFMSGLPTRWGNWFDEFRALCESGVIGVFTDFPDLACAARNAARKRR